MKIYTFWSADTTYYTKSRNLKKAQAIGRDNMKQYMDTCEYLGEQPTADKDYFIPAEIEEVTAEYFRKFVMTDDDILILDDDLRNLLK